MNLFLFFKILVIILSVFMLLMLWFVYNFSIFLSCFLFRVFNIVLECIMNVEFREDVFISFLMIIF